VVIERAGEMKDKRSYEMTYSYNACGKIAFPSRASARRYLKTGGKGWDHLRPYRCDDCHLIHNGHLPMRVVTGDITQKEWYARKKMVDAR
jgi:hypothetical protein